MRLQFGAIRTSFAYNRPHSLFQAETLQVMWQADYEIVIDAPPEAVWQVLTDLERYGQWNAYSPSAKGDLRVGGVVAIVAHLGNEQQHVNNRVLELIPNERLCWQSMNIYRWFVTGVRCRTLEVMPSQHTRFRQQETFTGLLSGVVRRWYESRIRAGLQIECESLRREVERRAREQLN
jgi:hypothetical protein